jgi:CelD/BcsL family acetyltransferase involved in cellulose biosynthesis
MRMATADTGTGAFGSANGEETRAIASRDTRFVAEVFDGADEALAALEVIESGLASTGFQTRDWLTVLFEEFSHTRRQLPRLVVVTDTERGEVVLALPLVVAKEGLLRVARFPDFGVCDYGAPLLGSLPLDEAHVMRGVWRSIRAVTRDVDLIRLDRMPAEIGGRRNPLLALFGSALSPTVGRSLVIEGRYEDYIRGLGKKYRKDLERCQRLWEAEPGARFFEATSDDEIAHVFATMEEQQAVWHAARRTKDILADPAIRQFYERLAIDGADAGLTKLFALEADGALIAVLFGIVHDGTFTLLRISTAGEQWSHLSPGRLVVLQTVKRLVPRGFRHFDMGVASDPLRHPFGTEELPLYDLVVAQDITALPKALAHEIVSHLRGSRRLGAALTKPILSLGS